MSIDSDTLGFVLLLMLIISAVGAGHSLWLAMRKNERA
jgi:hypothetical protein